MPGIKPRSTACKANTLPAVLLLTPLRTVLLSSITKAILFKCRNDFVLVNDWGCYAPPSLLFLNGKACPGGTGDTLPFLPPAGWAWIVSGFVHSLTSLLGSRMMATVSFPSRCDHCITSPSATERAWALSPRLCWWFSSNSKLHLCIKACGGHEVFLNPRLPYHTNKSCLE